MGCIIPNIRWKRFIVGRRTNLHSFNALQYLVLHSLPDSLCDFVSLDIWPIIGQKEDYANSFGEQVSRIHVIVKSIVAFFFEVGALAVGYYAYLALNGISVTGNSFADVLLPASLIMLFALNVALVSKWLGKETEETAVNSDAAPLVGATKKEQALKRSGLWAA